MDVRSIIERVEATDASVADRSTVQARLADLGKLSRGSKRIGRGSRTGCAT